MDAAGHAEVSAPLAVYVVYVWFSAQIYHSYDDDDYKSGVGGLYFDAYAQISEDEPVDEGTIVAVEGEASADDGLGGTDKLPFSDWVVCGEAENICAIVYQLPPPPGTLDLIEWLIENAGC